MAYGFNMIVGDPAQMARTAAQEAKESRVRQQAQTYIPLQQADDRLAMQRQSMEENIKFRQTDFERRVFESNRDDTFRQAEVQRNQFNIDEGRKIVAEADDLHHKWQVEAMQKGQKNAIEMFQIEQKSATYRAGYERYIANGERVPDSFMIEWSKFMNDSSGGEVDLRKILPPEQSFKRPVYLNPLLRDQKALAAMNNVNRHATKILQNWNQHSPVERKGAIDALKSTIDALTNENVSMAMAEKSLPDALLQTKEDGSWFNDEWRSVVSLSVQHGAKFSIGAAELADFMSSEPDAMMADYGVSENEKRLPTTTGQFLDAASALLTDSQWRIFRADAITEAGAALSGDQNYSVRPLANFVDKISNAASSSLVGLDGSFLISPSFDGDEKTDWSYSRDYQEQAKSIINKYMAWESREHDINEDDEYETTIDGTTPEKYAAHRRDIGYRYDLDRGEKTKSVTGKYRFYRAVVANAIRDWAVERRHHEIEKMMSEDEKLTEDKAIEEWVEDNKSKGLPEDLLRDFEGGFVSKEKVG